MRELYKFIVSTVAFLIVLVTGSSGQDSLRIGDAFDYLAYQKLLKHIETPDYYYSTAEVGIVKWNKEDFSYELLSKIDGLSDIEPMHLTYDDKSDAVIIAYANSNIDILYADQTLNVRDILVNQKVIGRRTINNLLVEDGILYVVADYGVSMYDLINAEFILTLFSPEQVVDFGFTSSYYFLSTRESFYAFNRKDGDELVVSLEEWEKLGQDNQLPVGKPGKIGTNEHCVLFQSDNDLYMADTEDLEFAHLRKLHKNDEIRFIKRDNDEMQVGVRGNRGSSLHSYVLKIDDNCTVSDSINSSCFNDLTDYLETKNGDVLLGDKYLGFHYIDRDGACNVINLPGPQGVQAYSLTFRNDTLYVTDGGLDRLRYNAQARNGGFSYFDGEEWHTYSILTHTDLRTLDFNDILSARPTPDGSKVYLNSAWKGLAEFDFEKFTFYNHENSCLETIGDNTVRLLGMAMDEEGNLWMSNYFTDHGLQYFGADGTCEALDIPVGSMLGEMVIDKNGILWACIIGDDGELLIYDTNTHETRVISSSNSVLSGNPRSLAVDKNGAVWVGATNGVYVFYNPFNGEGVRPVVDLNKNGIGDYLLMDQFVTAVGVDAANRKWFGTQNGLIVQSANGLDNEMRLTVDNSPLPSNVILDFAFDNEKGIAYIGTDKGILGLKIEAIEGTKVHKPNIYTYPNPVRPGYDGPIAIKGLAQDAHVRIVDQEGMLVKTLEAYGGQAIWDGTNVNNQKVTSGVYVVYSAAHGMNLKPDAATTKILVIR